MKTAVLLALTLLIHNGARADFSYTSSRKTTGGMIASLAGNAADGVTRVYFKGQKMKSEDGDTALLIDFDAQTITTINNAQKTFRVRNFSDLAVSQTQDVTIEVKETGQHKAINGFDAKELLLTMDVDMSLPGAAGLGRKMQVEIDLWISSAVPGGAEMGAFYQKNAAKFPWAMIGGGNNATFQSALAQVQKKIASMDGVTVEQIIRMKSAPGGGGPAMPAVPQMSAPQQAQLEQARARLQAMQAQGGPQAAIAAQALARLGGAAAGGAAPAGNTASLLEMTVDSADFLTNAVPDSVFAIPAGYQKTAQ